MAPALKCPVQQSLAKYIERKEKMKLIEKIIMYLNLTRIMICFGHDKGSNLPKVLEISWEKF